MGDLRPEIKVGLFVFAGILILTYLTLTFGNIHIGKERGYRITVYFDSVSGLEKKALVKIAGVDVGWVEDIKLKGTKAEVVLWIREGVKIPKDATAVIRTMGLMGEKYIEIVGGTGAKGYVAAGGTLGEGVSPADVDYLVAQLSDVAKDLKAVTRSLRNSIGTEEGERDIRETLANLRELTSNLAKMAANNRYKIDAIIENTEKLTRALNQLIQENRKSIGVTVANLERFSEKLPAIAENLEKISSTLADVNTRKNLQETIAELRKASANISTITSDIAQGKGTIGKLVKEDKVYQDLKETLDTLKEGADRVKRTKLTLEFKGDYMFRDLDDKYSYSSEPSNSYGYFTVRIQPREDRFYVLGITSDPRGDYDEENKYYYVDGKRHKIRKVKYERDVKFTLQYGIGLFPDLDVRVGLKDSTAGVGFDYKFFQDDTLVASFDVWDFSGEYSDHGEPRARVGLQYKIWKPFFVEVGWDDIFNSKFSSFFVGAGMRVTDEDLKYLLFGGGGVPVKK